MSVVYWAVNDKSADQLDIPHVCVKNRKNGRKWKWKVDVGSIYVDDREKSQISESGISKIFEKAREIDSEAQTPDSARHYSDREKFWSLAKNRSQGIFQLVFREKEDAIELADFVADVIAQEFDVDEVRGLE